MNSSYGILEFMNTVTISKNRIKKEGGVVILSVEEYRKLTERAVPEYYLTGKAAEDLDKLVEDGLKEYEAGKTIQAPSLKHALRKYAENRTR